MAQHASAAKQARQALRRRQRNQHYKTLMKTMIKKVRTAKEKGKAQEALQKTVKLLDQLAARGIIHPNKAANQKSKLTRLVNALK
jgi:small subunit ribosomal protein S20